MVGAKAVKYALKGISDRMVTLVRESNAPYKCVTGLAKLEDVANAQKQVPDHFINSEGNFVTEAFIEYAKPLIGDPLPEYVRLERIPVKR
jgi:6-phosphofructokinase 1